jgi:hypothetical protein
MFGMSFIISLIDFMNTTFPMTERRFVPITFTIATCTIDQTDFLRNPIFPKRFVVLLFYT